MKKRFYHNIVSYESLIVELNSMNLKEEEKSHLLTLIDENIDHIILDAILSQLSKKDKHLFLEQLGTENYNDIWTFLNSRIDGIEEKIKLAAEGLKKELHEDIKEAKK